MTNAIRFPVGLKQWAVPLCALGTLVLSDVSVEAQQPILVYEQHNDNYTPSGYRYLYGRSTYDPARLSNDDSNQLHPRIFNFFVYDVPKNREITFRMSRVDFQVRTYDHRTRSPGYYMMVELCNTGNVERFVTHTGVGSRIASGISPGFPPTSGGFRQRHQLLAPGNCLHLSAEAGLTSTDGPHARLIFDIHTTFEQASQARQRQQAEAQAAAARQRAQEEQRRQQAAAAAAQQRAAQERRAREEAERQREEEERLRQEEEARLLAEAERAQREEEDRLRREAEEAERARREELAQAGLEAVNRCNPPLRGNARWLGLGVSAEPGMYQSFHYPRGGDFSRPENYVCSVMSPLAACEGLMCSEAVRIRMDHMVERDVGEGALRNHGTCYDVAVRRVSAEMRYSPVPSRANIEQDGFTEPSSLFGPLRAARDAEWNARVNHVERMFRSAHQENVTRVAQCLESAGFNFAGQSLQEFDMWGTPLDLVREGEEGGARPGDPG